MLSAKSFRPSINSFEQAVKWIRIFVADIYARLVEEGVTENKRRPKTMHLHHRQGHGQGVQMRSKSVAISQGKKIDLDMLFDLAKNLLQQVIVDGKAWPCANLSLSVGGFEDGITGNKGIGSFLVRGEEAKGLETLSRSHTPTPVPEESRPAKRRRLDDGSTIGHFFKSESTAENEEPHPQSDTPEQNDAPEVSAIAEKIESEPPQQQDIATYFCEDCGKRVAEANRGEHQDWHFAKSLQAEDRSSTTGPSNSRPPGTPSSASKRGGPSKPRGRGGKPEKGQSRLAFG